MQERTIFITKRYKEHKIFDPRIEITDSIDSLKLFLDECLETGTPSGLDSENNSLNPLKAVPLLEQFGNKEIVYVLDRTSFSNEFLKKYTHVQYITQNGQYDHAIVLWNEGRFLHNDGINLRFIIDLMIDEQILRRGIIGSNSLESIYFRRLGIKFPEDKETRKEFILMNKNSIFYDKHILYSQADIRGLHKIYEIHRELIDKVNLQLRVYDIGYPLLNILSEMLINGSEMDKIKWNTILEENKNLKLKLERELDQELIKLGYKTKVREKQEIIALDLFGLDEALSNKNVRNINYGSRDKIIEIFKFFNLAVPTAKNDNYETVENIGQKALEQYVIDNPNLILKKFIKLLIEHKKITKRINSFGLAFVNELYHDPTIAGTRNNLIRGFYNNLTNKVHTKYKQEFTANGRLSSGSDKSESGKQKSKKKRTDAFFNSQQIPKEKKYRECFILEKKLIDEGWYRSTLDLSGAELVILGSQSKDKKLVELAKTDAHSYLSTQSFNDIIAYICNNMHEERAKIELYDLLRVNKVYDIITNEDGSELSKEQAEKITKERVKEALLTKKFIINKKTAKDIRDAVKNAVYAWCYGAKEDRIAATVSTAKYYGALIINTWKRELPLASSYLDFVAKTAITKGYVIFNNRTNSRHIFNSFLEAQKYGRPLNNSEKSDIQRDAMNYVISGTQADMIKESMVEVDKYFKTGTSKFLEQSIIAENIEAELVNNIKVAIPHKWIFQIHDEFVFDHKGKHVAENVNTITKKVCNLYLNGMTEMDTNLETLYTWTK